MTSDFFHKLNEFEEVRSLVFSYTMDVTNLYRNIPHEVGLEDYYLHKSNVPHSGFLLSLTCDVLTINYFMYIYFILLSFSYAMDLKCS